MNTTPPMSLHDTEFIEDLLAHYLKADANWLNTNCADTIEDVKEYLEAYLDYLYDTRAEAFAEYWAEYQRIMRRGGFCRYTADGWGPADCLTSSAASNLIDTTAAQIDAIEIALYGASSRDDSEFKPTDPRDY